MNSRSTYLFLAGLAAGIPCAVLAQDEAPEPSGWHFRFGAHVQFNYRVNIHDAQTPPSTVNGQFDNGFVKPDVSGNSTNTTFFGYTDYSSSNPNFAALDSGPSGTLTLTRFDNVPRAGALSGGSTTALGGEVSAAYEISSFRIWKKREAHWGVEGGYGFSTFDVSGSSSASGVVQRVTGVFSLPGGNMGFPLPPSPYPGYYSGPGTVLDSRGTYSTNAAYASATDTFTAKTSVDLSAFKFGPWVDFPLTTKLNLHLGVGYCAVFAQAEIDASETLTGITLGPDRQPPGAYHAAQRDWKPGFYGQVRLEYDFNDRWGAYLGADLQHNSNLSFTTGGRKFDVEMGSAYGASAGVKFSF